MYKCNICNFETENRSGLGGHIKNKHTIIIPHEKKEFIKNCLKCNIEFTVTRSAKFKFRKPKKEKEYCSRICANTREWSEEYKLKLSESVKTSEKFKLSIQNLKKVILNKKKLFEKPLIIKECICISCGKIFSVDVKFECKIPRKTCSKKCLTKVTGGYREGSGRSKHGYYKGIYCGSTYELIWVIYQLDHNLPCERFSSFLQKNNLKYYPDFFDKDTNTIIEIKGYENVENVNKKIELAKENGYNVIVLRKEDLSKEFDWVKNNYIYKELYQLYDNYKPKYSYVCSYCNKNVSRNHKAKTKNIFCSRSCAGKGKLSLTIESRKKFL